MSAVLREQGIVTVRDQVVGLVAQRWAKAFVYGKVTIHTSLEEAPPGLIHSNSAILSDGR